MFFDMRVEVFLPGDALEVGLRVLAKETGICVIISQFAVALRIKSRIISTSAAGSNIVFIR